MTTRLEAALARLEAALAAQHNPVLDGMQPGLPEREIRRVIGELGINPPQELIAWFGWHNGYVAPPGRTPRAWMGAELLQYTFDHAVSLYSGIAEGIDEFREFDLVSPDEDTEWFPLCMVRGGSYLVMNCGNGLQRGSVARWNTHAQGFRPGGYRPQTLAEPVEWWVELIESGTWRYDASTDYVEYDPAYVWSLSEQQQLSGLV